MARRPGLYPLDRAVPDPRLTPITPEADMGLGAADGLQGDEGAFARLREVGRLLDTVRIVDQLRELGTLDPGQLRDLSQWIEGGGAVGGQMQWPNAFWDSRQGGGALEDFGVRAGNLGPSETLGNAGSGFGMDWMDFTGERDGEADEYGLDEIRAGLARQTSGNEGREGAPPERQPPVDPGRAPERNDLLDMLRELERELERQRRGTQRDPGPDGVGPGVAELMARFGIGAGHPSINWRPLTPEGPARIRPMDRDGRTLGPRLALDKGVLVGLTPRGGRPVQTLEGLLTRVAGGHGGGPVPEDP